MTDRSMAAEVSSALSVAGNLLGLKARILCAGLAPVASTLANNAVTPAASNRVANGINLGKDSLHHPTKSEKRSR